MSLTFLYRKTSVWEKIFASINDRLIRVHTYMFHHINRENNDGEYGKVRLQDNKSVLFST